MHVQYNGWYPSPSFPPMSQTYVHNVYAVDWQQPQQPPQPQQPVHVPQLPPPYQQHHHHHHHHQQVVYTGCPRPSGTSSDNGSSSGSSSISNISNDKAVAFGEKFFKAWLSAVEAGEIEAFLERWTTEDVVLTCDGDPFFVSAQGRPAIIGAYRQIAKDLCGASLVHIVDDIFAPTTDFVVLDLSVTRRGNKEVATKRRWSVSFYAGKVHRWNTATHPSYATQSAVPPTITPVAQTQQQQQGQAAPVVARDSVLPAPSTTRPCVHNNWDSVRVKRGVALLRCRDCVSQWKLPASSVARCPAFLDGRSCGENPCPLLHVHHRKQPRGERDELYPSRNPSRV